jgi:hypothetical protein
LLHRLALVLLLSCASLLPGRADAARAPWGQGQSAGEDLEISLVTFGPGSEVVSWFGHTALVVEDHRLEQRRLYNYGMFGFGPDMLAKFAMGRLEFWVADTPLVVPTYRAYARDDRDVRVQKLNLDPRRRLELARALDDNVQPENRDYLYHHYFDNCATRPRDMIDRVLDGQLERAAKVPARMTLRDHTRRHSAPIPALSVLLDFLMNDEIDQPISNWEETFLPEELEALVARASYIDDEGRAVPLVARAEVFHRSATRAQVPPEPPAYAAVLLLLGLALGGGGVGLAAWYGRTRSQLPRVVLGLQHAVLGLCLGLPGTVLLLMGLVTDHTVTHWNENLLLANPLALIALPMGVALTWGSARAVKWLRRAWLALGLSGILAVLIKVIPAYDQDNWRVIGLILPISLGMAAASMLYPTASRRTAQDGDRSDREAPEPARAPRSAPGASLTSNASVRGSR